MQQLQHTSMQQSQNQWTQVRQRHWWRKKSHSRQAEKAVEKVSFRAEGRLKLQLAGRCFRCLAKDHRIELCREPVKCLRCRTNGHIAHQCPNRSTGNKRTLQPPPSSAVAASHFPQAKAGMEDRGLEHASNRPEEGFCAITVTQSMEEDLHRLCSLTIVVKVVGPHRNPSTALVTRTIQVSMRFPLRDITVSTSIGRTSLSSSRTSGSTKLRSTQEGPLSMASSCGSTSSG